jgi:hypothetical protein
VPVNGVLWRALPSLANRATPHDGEPTRVCPRLVATQRRGQPHLRRRVPAYISGQPEPPARARFGGDLPGFSSSSGAWLDQQSPAFERRMGD